jgi:hypothetical protein
LKKKGIRGIRGLQRQSRKNLESIGTEIFDTMESMGRSTLEDFMTKVENVPNASIKEVKILEYSDQPDNPGREFTAPDDALKDDVSESTKSRRSNDSRRPIHIPMNTDCEVQVKITCPNSKSASSNSIRSKKPPSWWILLVTASSTAESGNGKSSKQAKNLMQLDASVELLALKKLGTLRDHQTTSLYFTAPSVNGPMPFRILLVNDSVIGIDQVTALDSIKIE